MTDAERVVALQAFGYTPRQARFLLHVALHSGYFLRRQYVAFLARGHGLATTRFLAGTVARGHVRVVTAGRHGQLFHLCARPVYAAIDQEDNRHRREAEWAAVVRKLMTLDFVLAHPDAQFVATEADKVRLLRDTSGPAETCWPSKRYLSRRPGAPPTVRYFVDKMPWFRRPADPRLWLTYIDGADTRTGWETFLVQYRELLLAVPSGVAYVGREWDRRVRLVFERVIGSRAKTRPQHPATFRDYCHVRHQIEMDAWAQLTAEDLNRFREIRPHFAAPRYDVLYHRWLVEGDAVLADTVDSSPAVDCLFEAHRVPHPYGPSTASEPVASSHRR